MNPEVRQTTVLHDVAIPMQDGTITRAEVYLPSGDGPFPTVLNRTPYDRGFVADTLGPEFVSPLRATQAGYAVVVQDTRGRGGSEGDFEVFRNERGDGADTVEWITRQSFSNGKVCGAGASYDGATQLLTASTGASGFAALAPMHAFSDLYEGFAYQGGAFQLGLVFTWMAGFLAPMTLQRRQAAGADVTELAARLQEVLADPWASFQRLPLTDMPGVSELCREWTEWLEHPSRDEYWETSGLPLSYQAMSAPSLHIASWADIFLEGSLRNYEALRAQAADAGVSDRQRLIIGPWSHMNVSDVIGAQELGPAASILGLDLTTVHLDYFNEILADRDPSRPPVSIFVMGSNTWRDEEEWPLARAEDTALHLHSGGRANGRRGDGALSPAPPEPGQPRDSFVYDPRNPVPTVGGATLLPGGPVDAHGGFRDQSAVEDRMDVLVYTSPPLERDLEVTGRVALELWAATSAPDTDWTAKLVDVHPDGRPFNVCDGIIRARFRDGTDAPRPVPAGEALRYRIELGSTSMVFAAGHRLRLEVSSSNFPRFDRNPNTGASSAEVTSDDLRVAAQTILHDSEHPSQLVLPVVSEGGYRADALRLES